MEAGESRRWAGQEPACNCLWMFSFQPASLISGAPFYRDMAARLAHPVGGPGTVVRLQGGKGPVGIGNHVNTALLADQDGDVSRVGDRFGGSFGGLQNRFGVIEKCPHS